MRANAAYVVFERNETHRLWSRLHPDFNHCYVVVGFPNGYWVVLDQAYGVAKAMMHGPGVYGAIARTKPSAVFHTWLPADFDYPKKLWTAGLGDCVSVVKSFLGVTDWRVVTPFRLYRYLMERPSLYHVAGKDNWSERHREDLQPHPPQAARS
jgi:hypothetical protein